MNRKMNTKGYKNYIKVLFSVHIEKFEWYRCIAFQHLLKHRDGLHISAKRFEKGI